MVDNLSNDALLEFCSLFELFDIHKKGYILTRDFPLLLEAIGRYTNREELNHIIFEMDKKNTGKITFNSFMTEIGLLFSEKRIEEDILESFDSYCTTNNSNYLTLTEIKSMIKDYKGNDDLIDDEDIKMMVKEIDLENKDGINRKEFKDMLMKVHHSKGREDGKKDGMSQSKYSGANSKQESKYSSNGR